MLCCCQDKTYSGNHEISFQNLSRTLKHTSTVAKQTTKTATIWSDWQTERGKKQTNEYLNSERTKRHQGLALGNLKINKQTK